IASTGGRQSDLVSSWQRGRSESRSPTRGPSARRARQRGWRPQPRRRGNILIAPGSHRCRPFRARRRCRWHCRWSDRCCCAGTQRRRGLGRDSPTRELRGQRPSAVQGPGVAAGVEDTARHFIFGPEFPDASTRGLRNRIVREWEQRDDPPPYKVVSDSELPVIGRARFYGQELPMNRFCGFPPTPDFTGDLEEMSLLAGESAGQTKRLMSAASIIDEMISGAEAVIRERLGSIVVD